MSRSPAAPALAFLAPCFAVLFAAACAKEVPVQSPAADAAAAEADLPERKPLAKRVAACEKALENAEDQSTAGLVGASGAYRMCLSAAVDAQKIAPTEIAAVRATVAAVCAHKTAASAEAFGSLNRIQGASCPGARELDVAFLLSTYGPKATETIVQRVVENDICQAVFDAQTNGGNATQQVMSQAISAQNKCYLQRAADDILAGLTENVQMAKDEAWAERRFTDTYAKDPATLRALVIADLQAYDDALAGLCTAMLRANGEDGGTLGAFSVGACTAHTFKRSLP